MLRKIKIKIFDSWGEAGNRTLSYCFTDSRAATTLSTPLVAELGFEPRIAESKSAVLPLHHSAKLVGQDGSDPSSTG